MQRTINYMQRTINRNLLKYSAGRSIFCGQCSAIADARRWIVVSHNDDILGMCAPCWDALKKGRPTPGFEVVDGRVEFGRKKAAA